MRSHIKFSFNLVLHALCAVIVVFFGCWTVLANGVVLSGGSFTDLRRSNFIVLIASLGILVYLSFDHVFESRRPFAGDTEGNEDHEVGNIWIYLLIGAGLAAIFAFGRQYLIFWTITIIYFGVVYWQVRHAPILQFREANNQGLNYPAFAVAIAIAVLAALFINRPDADDSLYINMAVSVLDNSSAPIYATDTLHGVPGAYILPTYWVHSYELLAALFTQIFNVGEPIKVLHFIFGPLFSVFSVFTAAVCLQRLLPKWWGWACLVLTIEYLVLRESHRMYGNFAFVRMFEGKSVFITAIIPLIVVYATDFFVRHRLSSWILLMLVQICAVGFTANSLYVAPITAGLTLAACWRPSFPATRKLGLGLLASIYPVMIGFIIRSIAIRDGLSFENFQQFIPIDAAANLVLGEGVTLWLWLVGLTSAWCLVKNQATRHWVLGFCLAFMLTCMNPFLDEHWGAYVTAKYLTWRLFWVIPLPIFLSIFITQGVVNGFRLPVSKNPTFIFVALALLITLTLGKPWIDPDPLVRSELRIGLKVPQPEYEVARRLSEIAGKENLVLAPENISTWVPTFRGHAYPLVARTHYTEALLVVFASRIDTQDIKERLALAAYVDGVSLDNRQSEVLLRHWLKVKKLSAIAVPLGFKQITELTRILDEGGFDKSEYLDYLIFHR